MEASPQATIYGKTWYLEALGVPFKLLTVQENGKILAGSVLAKNPIKMYSNPLLCKYLGVYYNNFTGGAYKIETKRKNALKALLPELTKFHSYSYAFHPTFKNYLPFYWNNFSSKVFYSYWIPLKDRSIEAIQKEMYGKLRSEIKFALKSEYEIVYDIDFETFYTVGEKTFIRQGGKSPFSRTFLKKYTTDLSHKNAFKSLAVKDKEGRTMAIAGLIYDRHATSLVINGFDFEIMQRGANELLIFECIKFAMTQSDFFDFEGSMLEPIDSFYRKFGGEHQTYYKIYKHNVLNFAIEKGIKWYKMLKYGK